MSTRSLPGAPSCSPSYEALEFLTSTREGSTWRCGHPRTPWNTHGPYPSHSGQCAQCWRAARRRADERWLARLHESGEYLYRRVMPKARSARRRAAERAGEPYGVGR